MMAEELFKCTKCHNEYPDSGFAHYKKNISRNKVTIHKKGDRMIHCAKCLSEARAKGEQKRLENIRKRDTIPPDLSWFSMLGVPKPVKPEEK
jgi:NAD-dependent SIR2 family protein deacetylase